MLSKRLPFVGIPLLLMLLVGACRDSLLTDPGADPDPDPDSEPAPEELTVTTVEGHQSVGDTIVGSLVIRQGAELTVTGSRLEVEGDLTVERDAAIKGTQSRLDLVVQGNGTVMGDIISAGHLVIVSNPSELPTAEMLRARRDTLTVTTKEAVAAPTNPRRWLVNGQLEAGLMDVADGAAPASGFSASFTGGPPARSGGTVYINLSGDFVLSGPGGGAPPLVWLFPNGEDAPDITGCNVTARDGGLGGNLSLEIWGTLRLESVTISGGNGGDGGDATHTAPCADGSVNTAGNGGQPGWIFIGVEQFGFGSAISFDAAGINGWDGGDGGKATIAGRNGQAAGAQGASVEAKGGASQTLERYLYVSSSIQVGGGGAFLSVLNAGNGGDASAAGGNGAAGECNQVTGIASASGDGGNGSAAGGDGGSVRVVYSIHPSFTFLRSFVAGDGGDGSATGGTGANGVQCRILGGRGGNGGQADGVRGSGGTSAFPGTPGTRGLGTAAGGMGGNGGVSTDPPFNPVWGTGGRGGDGGAAFIDDVAGGTGGDAGDGGPAGDSGGDGGNGGCPGGAGGAEGPGTIPGQPGVGC